MFSPNRWLVSGALALAVFLVLPVSAPAKSSTWKDAQGASFRGEPIAILGPYALFRSGGNYGRRVPLHVFSPEECRRLAAEIAARPPRAASFAQAKGDATSELVGKVSRVQSRVALAPADLASIPEPELLLVLVGSHNEGEGWNMVSNMQALYWRMQRVYPGLVEAVFLGARHDAAQQANIALSSFMPWLVADYSAQRTMSLLGGFIPPEGTNMVLASRDGVPLAAAPATDVAAMRDFSDKVSDLLWLMNPANPAGWADRLYYANATRPAEFARGEAPPLLVGNPLRAEGLRQYGVKRIAARLAVAADGKVTPTLLSGPDDVPPQLAAPLTAALRQAVVSPAIAQGRAVAGNLEYVLEVPPVDAQLDADRAWLAGTHYPVLPITDWLVLRPIKVPEQEFDPVEGRETVAGKVEFKALEVNTGKISRVAQMNAFNSDWFGAAGADSVRPKAGDRQKIDDATELTWEKITSKDGFVDLQTGLAKDYVVGYAWTEFEVPAATEAWLGLGSDDGVKIWLNGQLVHDKWVRRQSRVDDDVVALPLKAGKNRLLIKIQNATIDWSFIYRVRTKPAR